METKARTGSWVRSVAACAIAIVVVFCSTAIADEDRAARDSANPGHPNELLITGVGDFMNSINIFEYRDGTYYEVWSTITPDVSFTTGGGEAGDLTGDGIPEIVLSRSVPNSSAERLEVWTFDPVSHEWVPLWSQESADRFYVGDISDVDNDGVQELIVTDRASAELNLYSFNGTGMQVEATVRDCGSLGAFFVAAAGDLDGDETPEILFQCYVGEHLNIYEFDGAGYPMIGTVILPPSQGSDPMIIDDMECADVNRDGVQDAVFCGNSSAVHVVTYDAGAAEYVLEYSSPSIQDSLSQTCSVGDVTNDGYADMLVVPMGGARVYSYDGNAYNEVWHGLHPIWTPTIGESFVGDADNDGRGEFLFGGALIIPPDPPDIWLYESDANGASSFENTFLFPRAAAASSTIIIADLNPFNIFASGLESGDTSAWSATVP